MFVEDEEIETTPTHPFWVIGKGWVAAGDMEVGDKVYLYSGEGREIKELKFEHLDSPIKVYNFEVEDWHTYFVSEHDVFVHNSCKGYDKQKKGTPRNNQAQNKQFRDIVKKLKLNKNQQRLLHEEITGQNYSYQEILSIAKDMFW